MYTVVSSSRLDAIRSVYGPGVARDLIAVTASSDDETSSTFKMDGFISSANYSAKKTVMVLFINGNIFPIQA